MGPRARLSLLAFGAADVLSSVFRLLGRRLYARRPVGAERHGVLVSLRWSIVCSPLLERAARRPFVVVRASLVSNLAME